VLLGPRLDALDVRRLVRRLLRRPDPMHKPVEQLFWYRSSKFVMRRWAPIGLAVIALLVLLGLPFTSVKWGFPDDRVLPPSASSHQVGDQLRTNFAHDSATSVPIVVPDARGVSPADLDAYAAGVNAWLETRRQALPPLATRSASSRSLVRAAVLAFSSARSLWATESLAWQAWQSRVKW